MLFLIVFTDTGVVVAGTTARLVETLVTKSVNTNENTSLNPHWNWPYSLEANKKSKLKYLPYFDIIDNTNKHKFNFDEIEVDVEEEEDGQNLIAAEISTGILDSQIKLSFPDILKRKSLFKKYTPYTVIIKQH